MRIILTTLFYSAFFITALPAPASGRYPPIVPARPPSEGEAPRIDERTYEVGQRVFLSRLQFEEYNVRRAQQQGPWLEQWQSALPRTYAKRVNLPRLAGRLSEYQFGSLRYFLAVRFNIRSEDR